MLRRLPGRRSNLTHSLQTATRMHAQEASRSHPVIRTLPSFLDSCPSTVAGRESLAENDLLALRASAGRNGRLFSQTRVTSIPAFLRARKSDLGIPRSVMIWCRALGGPIREKLRRPNLLESHTATIHLATSTITRFTFASRRLGVLSPKRTSKPSTPRKRMSAFSRRKVSSAIGPTRENEFFRKVPPVKITSMALPASSDAIFTALVTIVRFRRPRSARAIAVVVVPESRII